MNNIFTKNIKVFSLTLIILGLLGLAYGFLSVPSSVSEAQAMVGVSDHGEEHDSSSSHQKEASEVIEGEDHVSQASNSKIMRGGLAPPTLS